MRIVLRHRRVWALWCAGLVFGSVAFPTLPQNRVDENGHQTRAALLVPAAPAPRAFAPAPLIRPNVLLPEKPTRNLTSPLAPTPKAFDPVLAVPAAPPDSSPPHCGYRAAVFICADNAIAHALVDSRLSREAAGGLASLTVAVLLALPWFSLRILEFTVKLSQNAYRSLSGSCR